MQTTKWFEWDDDLTTSQVDFLVALREYALRWSMLGLNADDTMVFIMDTILVVGVDLSDIEHNCVMRTLRADLHTDKIVCGHDPTHQFCGLLNLKSAECMVYTSVDPFDLAEAAVTWFESELQRSIERHEWKTGTYHHLKWKYSSADTYFMWSDSENRKRTGLGPPHRRVVVRKCECEI